MDATRSEAAHGLPVMVMVLALVLAIQRLPGLPLHAFLRLDTGLKGAMFTVDVLSEALPTYSSGRTCIQRRSVPRAC